MADEVVLASWQYMFWMIGIGVTASIFSLVTILLLPDPDTLAKLRENNEDVVAQNLAESYENYNDDELTYEYYQNPTDEKYEDDESESPSFFSYSSNEKHKDNKEAEEDHEPSDEKQNSEESEIELYYRPFYPKYAWTLKAFGKLVDFYNYQRAKINAKKPSGHYGSYEHYHRYRRPEKRPHYSYEEQDAYEVTSSYEMSKEEEMYRPPQQLSDSYGKQEKPTDFHEFKPYDELFSVSKPTRVVLDDSSEDKSSYVHYNKGQNSDETSQNQIQEGNDFSSLYAGSFHDHSQEGSRPLYGDGQTAPEDTSEYATDSHEKIYLELLNFYNKQLLSLELEQAHARPSSDGEDANTAENTREASSYLSYKQSEEE